MPADIINIGAAANDGNGDNLRAAVIKINNLDIQSVKNFGAKGDGVANDTTSIQTAVDFCNTNGCFLEWPVGTYVTTASISNLHDVRHRGAGIIKRGTDTFALESRSADQNRIFVATTGSDSNDGLSTSEPFLTIQAAFDVLEKQGRILQGQWEVVIGAGTYIASGTNIKSGTRSRNRIIVRGAAAGHPNVPTTIIDGSSGVSGQHGLSLSEFGFAEFRDIKCINFSHSDTSTGGFVSQNGADLLLTNGHSTGSSWFGCTATAKQSALRVAGGIFDGDRIGIRMNNAQHTVGQGATMLSEGPIVRNSTECGFLGSRLSQGHVDFTLFEDCLVAITCDRNSRVADVQCDFRRNGAVFKTRTGGIITADKDNVYNIGLAAANTTLFDFGAFSGPQEEFLDRTGVGPASDARSEILIARDTSTNSHTGDTLRTVVATPFTMPAGYFADGGTTSLIGPKLRYRITGGKTNGGTPGGLNIGLQFGGSSITQFAIFGTVTDDWVLDVEIWATGPASQQITGTLVHGTTSSRRHFGVFTRSIDMEVDQALQIDIQLGDAGDTGTVESIEIWRTG